MTQAQIIVTYIISNLVAITFFTVSLKWKQVARVLFAALFFWAAWTNWSVAQTNPDFYLNYSKYAISIYQDIIVGTFLDHMKPIVSFIALCQLLIAIGLLYGGIFLKTACIGGIIFLVAISPLGIASAFPSGLIWSAGLFVLYKYPFHTNIFGKKLIA
ncbi:MAG: hypothetical protein JWQ40_1078 [Segetibacter sp.]|nr:hypothetical protein [Segetibacter sp.]